MKISSCSAAIATSRCTRNVTELTKFLRLIGFATTVWLSTSRGESRSDASYAQKGVVQWSRLVFLRLKSIWSSIIVPQLRKKALTMFTRSLVLHETPPSQATAKSCSMRFAKKLKNCSFLNAKTKTMHLARSWVESASFKKLWLRRLSRRNKYCLKMK